MTSDRLRIRLTNFRLDFLLVDGKEIRKIAKIEAHKKFRSYLYTVFIKTGKYSTRYDILEKNRN